MIEAESFTTIEAEITSIQAGSFTTIEAESFTTIEAEITSIRPSPLSLLLLRLLFPRGGSRRGLPAGAPGRGPRQGKRGSGVSPAGHAPPLRAKERRESIRETLRVQNIQRYQKQRCHGYTPHNKVLTLAYSAI